MILRELDVTERIECVCSESFYGYSVSLRSFSLFSNAFKVDASCLLQNVYYINVTGKVKCGTEGNEDNRKLDV